jgi:hypothetical protein
MSTRITYICRGCNKESKVHTVPGVLPEGWIEATIKTNSINNWYPAIESEYFCSVKCLSEVISTLDSFSPKLVAI